MLFAVRHISQDQILVADYKVSRAIVRSGEYDDLFIELTLPVSFKLELYTPT